MYFIYVRNVFEKFGVEFFILCLMLTICWGGIQELIKILITHLK
jgi:hypothetical protein